MSYILNIKAVKTVTVQVYSTVRYLIINTKILLFKVSTLECSASFYLDWNIWSKPCFASTSNFTSEATFLANCLLNLSTPLTHSIWFWRQTQHLPPENWNISTRLHSLNPKDHNANYHCLKTWRRMTQQWWCEKISCYCVHVYLSTCYK